MNEPKGGQGRWLDQPRNVTRLVWLLYGACALLLGVDAVVHRHTHFSFEGWFGFYAIMGFGAYCVIVLSAKALRRVLRREVDYYGDGDEQEGRDG